MYINHLQQSVLAQFSPRVTQNSFCLFSFSSCPVQKYKDNKFTDIYDDVTCNLEEEYKLGLGYSLTRLDKEPCHNTLIVVMHLTK